MDCSAARIAACIARLGGGPGELGGGGADDREGDLILGSIVGGLGGAAGGVGAEDMGGGGAELGIGGAEEGGSGGGLETWERVVDGFREPGGGGGFLPIGGGGPRRDVIDAGRLLRFLLKLAMDGGTALCVLDGGGRGGMKPGTGGAAELGIFGADELGMRGADGREDSGSDV